MRFVARLHLPDGLLDVVADRGDAVEVPAAAVAGLLDRRDRRDRITLDGRRIDRRGTAGRVRAGLASVSDAVVAPDVSVRDHLAAVTSVRRADDLLASSPLLAGRGDGPAGVLSGGERRVLAVLRAVATGPRVVLLDGAGEGLDAASLAWLGDVVRDWRAAGVPVLVRPGRPEERSWLDPGPRGA
ncbi:MAG: hypothetical protein KY457_02140 [Actinobacteria bacterium]|nr:hypothetical protein [Actinomycetota bacterium]